MRTNSRPCIVLFLCLGILWSSAEAVNGVAVSVKCPFRNKTEGDFFGHINRLDIVNSQVVRDTIVYNASSGFARLPCISQDGRRICFYRDGDKWVNSQMVTGTPDYLSVMDIDGTSLINLVTFSGAQAVNHYDYTQGGTDRYADWPAGDWIYYQKPTTTEIWRVNVSSLANELVKNFPNGNGVPYINRFSLSADGTHANQFSNYCVFPGMTACASGQGFGCNHTMSASGRFINGWLINRGTILWPASYRAVGDGQSAGAYDSPYQGRSLGYGGHAYFDLLDWNWTTGVATNFGLFTNDCICYRHVSYMIGSQYLKQVTGNPMVGAVSEFPRWSANSDKWVLHSPGQNQVLYNWVDRQAILGGRNQWGSYNANDAGDFWVQPPDQSYAGTRYEDISGAWLPLGTQSTAPLPDYIRGPGCANPNEISLKYGDLVIMPKSVYDTIAKGQPATSEHPGAASYAVVVPDISIIVVPAGSSLQVTVTNQNYDPIDPIFGKPPAPPSWRIIGSGASITPATGTSPTITATGAFSACSVEVSMTVGAVTKAVRKLVAVQAPVSVRDCRANARNAAMTGMRISPIPGGAVTVTTPDAGSRFLEVYRANGSLVYKAATAAGCATIPAGVIRAGTYVFRLRHRDGTSTHFTWMAR